MLFSESGDLTYCIRDPNLMEIIKNDAKSFQMNSFKEFLKIQFLEKKIRQGYFLTAETILQKVSDNPLN